VDTTCVKCGGELFYLGTLGTKHWFRCRGCGLDQSIEDEPVDEAPEEPAIEDETLLDEEWVTPLAMLKGETDIPDIGEVVQVKDGTKFTISRIVYLDRRLNRGGRTEQRVQVWARGLLH